MATLLLLLAACPQGEARPADAAATAAAQAQTGDVEPSAEATAGPAGLDDSLPELAVDDDEFHIPAWLLAAPSLQVLFPPCGDVVTLGQPGSFERQASGIGELEEAEFGRWYVYSAEGELLDALPDGIHWFEHYFPAWRAKFEAATAAGNSAGEYAGYLIFSDADGVLLEVYNYDGTPMAGDFDPMAADFERMHQLHGDELVALPASQAE